jgi:hypothetical protein
MNKTILLVLMSIMLVSFVSATDDCSNKWFCANDFNTQCQNFYGDSKYFTIEEWNYNEGFLMGTENTVYSRFDIAVSGIPTSAQWTSNTYEVKSVIAKSGEEMTSFEGGLSGSVDNAQDIDTLIFCGYNSGKNKNMQLSAPTNGVPEFPAYSIGAAVLVVTLGLVFLRRD